MLHRNMLSHKYMLHRNTNTCHTNTCYTGIQIHVTQIHVSQEYSCVTCICYTRICSYTNTYPCGTLCGAGSCTKEVRCSALRCVAVCYSVLQRVLVANTPLWTRFCRDPEFHVYKRGVLRCGIVCDIVLQGVAVVNTPS